MKHWLGKFSISRLHVRLFVYFTLTVLIAELLVFGAYRLGFGRDRFGRFEGVARSHALLLREAVQRRVGQGKAAGLRRAADLFWVRKFVKRLAADYGGRVWLATPGRTLVDSHTGPVPHFPEHRLKHFKDFSVAWNRKGQLFVRLPLQLSELPAATLFFQAKARSSGGSEILPALLGLVLAFLALSFPVAHFITRPIANLRDTALAFAGGDLAQRAAPLKGKELGELAHSFNLMAERIERMLVSARDLSAHVSHELRSPLARIRLAEEMLRTELSADATQTSLQRLDDIRSEIELIDELVGKILQFAELERREAQTQGNCNAVQILDETLLEFRLMLERAGLRVDGPGIGLNPATVQVAIAPDLLRTALRAAIENAIQYAPAGTAVQIQCLPASSQSGQTTRLRIRNECTDVPADLKAIFEPFRRASNRTGGHGLGLAIVARALELGGAGVRALKDGEQGFMLELVLPRA